MSFLFRSVNTALEIYMWLLLAVVVIYLLDAFNVVSTKSNVIAVIRKFIVPATEPVLRLARRIFPPLAGVDVSPVIVIVVILLVRYAFILYVLPGPIQ
jgi:YggT family protein